MATLHTIGMKKSAKRAVKAAKKINCAPLKSLSQSESMPVPAAIPNWISFSE
jgi:hypothetical protein